MKTWLTAADMTDDERMLNRTRKLHDMRGGIVSTSAWRLLRWIVASNTSYLKVIEEEDELIQGIPKDYRQFRLIVGSPAKEHLLAESVKEAQVENTNAVKFPTLFAWHGSAVKNWHSMYAASLPPLSLFLPTDASLSRSHPLSLAASVKAYTSKRRSTVVRTDTASTSRSRERSRSVTTLSRRTTCGRSVFFPFLPFLLLLLPPLPDGYSLYVRAELGVRYR